MLVAEIAEMNDRLRRSIPLVPPPNRLVITTGVAGLPEKDLSELFQIIRVFKDFYVKENDPYGERDFGAVELKGQKYFFKFDYYDSHFEFFEENGIKVITVMRADEY
jgi:hypothetical protein